MDLFDVNVGTLLIVLVLGHISTGILVLSYTGKLNNSKAIKVFLLSKLFQSIAWAMVGLRIFTSGMVLKTAANAILLVGVALELIAFLVMKDSFTKTKKAYISLLIVCVAVFIFTAALDTSESFRIAVASFFAAVLMALPVYVLYADRYSSPLQKVITTFYSVTVLFLLCRAYAALVYGLDMDLSSTNTFNTGLFLLLYLVMFAGSIGFILLDKEKMDSEMLRAASFDELTNVLNRRTFILRSKEVIAFYAKKHEEVSCLMIDIDDFKKINDEHGHYMGDIVLLDFVDTIKKSLRNCDLFGRYGGDEFAVLLPGADEGQSTGIAERLRQAAEGSIVDADPEIKYTISIGAATIIPNRETDVDLLYKLSDNALYLAKAQGKNHVALLPEGYS